MKEGLRIMPETDSFEMVHFLWGRDFRRRTKGCVSAIFCRVELGLAAQYVLCTTTTTNRWRRRTGPPSTSASSGQRRRAKNEADARRAHRFPRLTKLYASFLAMMISETTYFTTIKPNQTFGFRNGISSIYSSLCLFFGFHCLVHDHIGCLCK